MDSIDILPSLSKKKDNLTPPIIYYSHGLEKKYKIIDALDAEGASMSNSLLG